MIETPEQMRELLTEHFIMVATTRMEGVPVVNKALSVTALGFEEFGDYRVGVMLTPWFMNLMLMPLKKDVIDPQKHKFGTVMQHVLPGGRFAFIVSHEEELGFYLSCSLFSPVSEFADQAAFEETAAAVLDEVMTPAQEKGEEELDEEELADAEMRELWTGRKPEPKPVDTDKETNVSGDEINPDAEKQEEGPRRKLPAMSSQMSRRDVLRGLRTLEELPLKQKEPS